MLLLNAAVSFLYLLLRRFRFYGWSTSANAIQNLVNLAFETKARSPDCLVSIIPGNRPCNCDARDSAFCQAKCTRAGSRYENVVDEHAGLEVRASRANEILRLFTFELK